MKPLRARKAQKDRVEGLVWMRTWQQIGTRGVASKLKGLLKCPHADMRGVMLDWGRRLSEISV